MATRSSAGSCKETDLGTSRTRPEPSKLQVLFEGDCRVCNGIVRWLTAHDPDSRFEYIPLQSEQRDEALRAADYTDELPDSLVVIDEDGVHVFSSAMLALASQLAFPWSLGLSG
jgi:predicted DCC family thiol-disulfide oxidoreductase YuxK